MAQITVLVPIYKVEAYLRKCLDSLLQQSFQDFVVFAINDGSPDNCQSIIEEYVQKDPVHIRGFKKENGGYGSVLELGISQCETEYFLVCDPDDWLEENALQNLYDLATTSTADLTIGAKTFVYEDGSSPCYDAAYNTAFVTLKKNTIYGARSEAFNDLFFVDPSPHAKLYKTALSEKIVFPHHVGYTDNLLFYMNLLQAQKVVYTDTSCAFYLVDRAGNTMTDVREKALRGQIEVFTTIFEQAEGLNPPAFFWYRMFESYKFMLYQSRRLTGTKQSYGVVLDALYGLVEQLLPHREAILPLYKKLSKNGFLEKHRDQQLLNPATSKKAFDQLKKKMIQEFVEK